MIHIKKISYFALIGLCVLFLSACAKSYSSPAMPPSASVESAPINETGILSTPEIDMKMSDSATPEMVNGEADYGRGQTPLDTNPDKKIIVTGNERMTTKSLDDAIVTINSAVFSHGGYIESSSFYANGNDVNPASYGKMYLNDSAKSYFATIKIPAENFQAVRAEIETVGKVVSYSENIEDASAVYYDIQSKLDTKLVEEKRVLELVELAAADEKTETAEILALEQRLGEIRTQIELYKAQMNSIDRLSSYSTLNLNLDENATATVAISKDLFSQISVAFSNSLRFLVNVFQGLIVFVAGAFVPVIIVAFFVACVAMIRRVATKK